MISRPEPGEGAQIMPELPEVEKIKNVIEPQIRGLVMTNVTVNHQDVIAYPAPEEFCKRLTGQTILYMTRRGKFMTIHLSGGLRVVLHLRMTGCLLLTPAEFPEEKHTHVIFRLSNGRELRFSDTRRFGRFWLFSQGEADHICGIHQLGIEPLGGEVTGGYLSARFGKRRKAVKECLLDQKAIAGIGNIYSDEILFAAGIHPARLANSLTGEEWERLAGMIPGRLSFFIEKNKITPEEYLETKGKDYRNTPFLQVYGHAGEPCPACGETLCRIVIGGRGSVYCPACQKNLAGEARSSFGRKESDVSRERIPGIL